MQLPEREGEREGGRERIRHEEGKDKSGKETKRDLNQKKKKN